MITYAKRFAIRWGVVTCYEPYGMGVLHVLSSKLCTSSPLLDCRERDFILSQMHMVLKSWSLQNGGVCFVVSFGCDFLWSWWQLHSRSQLDILLSSNYKNGTIVERWNHCREGRWGWWWDKEFNYFSCHNWQRIIHGAQQSTVMQRRQQHHFDALVFPLGMGFVWALGKLHFFNSSSPA